MVDLRVLKGIVSKSFQSLMAKAKVKGARGAAATKAPTKATRGGSARGPIDAYLARLENPVARATLTRLCIQLRELLPTATETISYDMPAFRLPTGKVAAGFAFFGKSCGYYPHSGNVVPKLGALVAGYKTTKGGIAFAPDAAAEEDRDRTRSRPARRARREGARAEDPEATEEVARLRGRPHEGATQPPSLTGSGLPFVAP